eukprot:jgi/Mesvir1/3456/Mv11950-RA.1
MAAVAMSANAVCSVRLPRAAAPVQSRGCAKSQFHGNRVQHACAAFSARPAARRSSVVCGLFGLGVPELVVIAGVSALLFGPSKLPELGKGLGKTIKSFQEAAKEFQGEIQREISSDKPEEADGKKEAPPKEK